METRGEDREDRDQTSEVIIVSEEVFTIGGRICSIDEVQVLSASPEPRRQF